MKGHGPFGRSSDPLTQFAVIVHDADHPRVTNVQFVRVGAETAVLYKKKCCRELLMQERVAYEECRCFRQLVMNAVIATDIADKELKSKMG